MGGVLPLYFVALHPAGAVEVVALRTVLTFVFCVIVIVVIRRGRRVLAVLRDRRMVAWSMLAAVLISINWHTYVYASMSGQVVEAALGYFLNPIVTVVLGVLLLQERLRLLQWVAVALCAMAAVVLVFGLGRVPWVALVIAGSFGVYGYVKNRMGPRVGALEGLAIETGWLLPLAAVEIVLVAITSGLVTFTVSPDHTVAVLLAGVATGVPLLLFATAARRLPLSVLGLLQYLSPVLQFAVGVVVLNEAMPLERWLGFAIVWVALLVLAADQALAKRTTGGGPARLGEGPPPTV